jgi:hypothetical protein
LPALRISNLREVPLFNLIVRSGPSRSGKGAPTSPTAGDAAIISA